MLFCLNELQPFTIEGIEFKTVDVGASVVHTYRLGEDYPIAEANATVAAVSGCTLILVDDEHLLGVVVDGCVDHSGVPETRQYAVEKVLVDCFL